MMQLSDSGSISNAVCTALISELQFRTIIVESL